MSGSYRMLSIACVGTSCAQKGSYMQTRTGVLRNKVFVASSRILAVLSILIAVTALDVIGMGSIAAHAAGPRGQVPAPGGVSPCPPNSTGYTGVLDPYNCD